MSNTEPKMCRKCGENEAGPGGILCPLCKEKIETIKL